MTRFALPALLLALALPGLSGCAAIGVHWHKEGATQEDLELAQKTCGQTSQGYDFVFDADRGGRDDILRGERRAGSATGAVYRECMERMGWRRVRGERPPRAT